MPEIFDKNDSCGFVTPLISAYYGPSVIDPDTEEWCFIVKNNRGKTLFIRTNSELLTVAQGESPMHLLVAGMALYHSR